MESDRLWIPEPRGEEGICGGISPFLLLTQELPDPLKFDLEIAILFAFAALMGYICQSIILPGF